MCDISFDQPEKLAAHLAVTGPVFAKLGKHVGNCAKLFHINTNANMANFDAFPNLTKQTV